MDQIKLDETGRALIRAVAATPLDDAPRLIFADWLDETGREAEGLWSRLIRIQVEVSRYKWENERHLPANPRKATKADLARVRPRDVRAEMGLESRGRDEWWFIGDEPWPAGWFADLLLALPGWGLGRPERDQILGDPAFSPFDFFWCHGRGPYSNIFSRFTDSVLTNDLVTVRVRLESPHWWANESQVTFWRGFPVEVETYCFYANKLKALAGLQEQLPTFAVWAVNPADPDLNLQEFFDSHPPFPFEDRRRGATPVLATAVAAFRQDEELMEAYWRPGTSLAPPRPTAVGRVKMGRPV